MKKILSFFAVLLMAITASATIKNITPTSPKANDNLRQALESAVTGDTIVMAAGTYNESASDYLAFYGKEVVVRAAKGADVILKTAVCVRLKTGAKAEFIGIKFDCSNLTNYSNLIVPADDTQNKRVILKNCEFYGWAKNSAMIQSTSSRRLDVIDIDSCYFHNCEKSCVFVENPNLVSLSITNSTFANITATNTSSFWAAPIFVYKKTKAGSVLVDHCTFYNCETMSLSYGVVTVDSIADPVVSNCIFVLPESKDRCATNLEIGGQVNNCLTYHYDNWQPYGHYNTATVTNCIGADPLFVDATNGDFTLGAASPAFFAGTDESNLGDPRWYPGPRTLYLKPGNQSWAGQKYAVYAFKQGTSHVSWSNYMTLAQGETDIYTTTIPGDLANVVFVRFNPNKTTDPDWDIWGQTIDLTLVEGKQLFIVSEEKQDNKNIGAWAEYGLTNGYYVIGSVNGWTGDWNISALTSDQKLSANPNAAGEYLVNMTLAIGNALKVVEVNNYAIANWYPGGVGNNYEIGAGNDGYKTIYFRPDGTGGDGWHYGYIYIGAPIRFYIRENAVANVWGTICLPYAATLSNANAYQIQTINLTTGIVVEEVNALEAGKTYLVRAIEDGNIIATMTGDATDTPVENNGLYGNLGEDDAIIAATDVNYDYYILSENTFHHLEGTAQSNVAQYKGYLRFAKNVTAPDAIRIIDNATNIQNVEGNEAAVKFIQNGQLFIKKNGIVYDVTGAIVK